MLLAMNGVPGQFPFQRQPYKPKSPIQYRSDGLCCDPTGDPIALRDQEQSWDDVEREQLGRSRGSEGDEGNLNKELLGHVLPMLFLCSSSITSSMHSWNNEAITDSQS